jgi:uncharacterized protein DUF6644
MNEFLEWLQNTPVSLAISGEWFPLVESLHVIAIALVAGTIFIVDTRLLGITSTKLPFTYVSDRLLPWTWAAFAFAVITGTLMFMGNAVIYYENQPFRVKMILLLAAGLNMLLFQLVTFRGVAAWDNARPPIAARAAGFLSISLWCSVIGFGRWIGFVA